MGDPVPETAQIFLSLTASELHSVCKTRAPGVVTANFLVNNIILGDIVRL